MASGVQAVGSLTLGRSRGVRRFIRQQGTRGGPVTLTECAVPGKSHLHCSHGSRVPPARRECEAASSRCGEANTKVPECVQMFLASDDLLMASRVLMQHRMRGRSGMSLERGSGRGKHRNEQIDLVPTSVELELRPCQVTVRSIREPLHHRRDEVIDGGWLALEAHANVFAAG